MLKRFTWIASCLQVVTDIAALAKEQKVQVHFVPHSHMDAGWLKTYDDYYEENVRLIFKSVFDQLKSNKKYTYTVGDLAYFRRYYEEVSKEEQNFLKSLVEQERLEIVHGGLVSPDEASANYADILRNFEAGHDFVQ